MNVTERGKGWKQEKLICTGSKGPCLYACVGGCRLTCGNYSSNWMSPMRLQVCQVLRGEDIMEAPFLDGRPEVTNVSKVPVFLKTDLVKGPSRESPFGTAKAEGGRPRLYC